ncbi:2-C-methyl-D-erythritol 4-phosphate cytidylyltransferase [Sedimentibacter sp. zth1]|uniref:2-C-methyl-D-erythritol 4-phosphate cytidylyltransferase n=1 Tax=Sedimentibacter sp. zth1 TaxID=2816908 RepID=UPI001A92F495|nr:2-C-methyl-D-erythritol 4-phosphate cytidylyltransferase [Sedimentibacter sp. zth1]QSX04904.1 2-C-methyl-D-erythritol 4-phosphate cytidylyltransferase [Sedimentibacter sp. zth1]
MYKEKYVVAIIVAGGKGTRMGENRPKQYLMVDDKYIVEKTIEQFEKNNKIDDILLVVNYEDIEFVKTKISCDKPKISKIVVGGSERINSVNNGINAIKEDMINGIVLIHDGVRPFASQGLINNCIENAYEFGACVPTIDIVDTIKKVNDEDIVKKTLDRSKYKAIQTPQAFKYEIISECYKNALLDELSVTDDSSIVEHYGYEVKAIKGLQKNIKITTQFDLRVAELISRMV